MWATFSILIFTACSDANEPRHNPAFDLPAELYSVPGYKEPDLRILHPAGYLELLETKPVTDCDREALRRLVIALNMYSEDQMNQTYFMSTDNSGAKILIETFPKFKEMTGEGGRVININKMSDYLRTLSFSCD